jgi:hypothetical protein
LVGTAADSSVFSDRIKTLTRCASEVLYRRSVSEGLPA